MSASSSPFRPSNTPVYIDDSLSPVKLPTRSPMKPPPPFSLPNKSSQQGTPPVKETTNTSPSKPAQHNILKPPYTEKLNKTTFLNISSAQRRSTIGNPGRSYSSGERRMLNLRSSSSLNKPSPNTVSTTSPLHKRRKPANLNSIQKSAREVELYMDQLNEEREKRLKQSGFRSSMSEADELSSPIKRNTLHSHRDAVELDEINDEREAAEPEKSLVEEDEEIMILEDKGSNKASESVENIEIGRRDIIDTIKDFGANIDDLRRRKRNLNGTTDYEKTNSSDSDLEILEDNFSRDPSQTLTHNQMTRLINELKQDKYSTKTPDRMTEPQPQRPHPHHVKTSAVDNDQEDTVLSPLRHDLGAVDKFQDEEQDVNEFEDEPTMNFLDSPNSRPMFPLTYIEKLQSDNQKELSQVNDDLKQRELQISQLSEELAKQREVEHKLKHEQEINQLQIRQLEHEVAFLTKRNKILEWSNLSFKRKLNDYKITVNEVEETNRALIEKNNDLDEKFTKLQNDHSQVQKEHIEFTMKVDDFESDKLRLVNEKEELVNKLYNIEQEYESKIDRLEENLKLLELSDNELRLANNDLKTKLEASDVKNEQLQLEKDNLLAKIDETEGLINDLDHLIATHKEDYEKEIVELKNKHEKEISQLSMDLRSVKQNEAQHKQLVDELTHELETKTIQFNDLKSQIDLQVNELEKAASEKDHLGSKLTLLQNVESDKNLIESELIDLKNKYETDISSKDDEIYNLTTKHNRLQTENQQFKSIISELETQVQTQSQIITSKESDISTYKSEIDKLLNAINTLKQDLSTTESKLTQLNQEIEMLHTNHKRDLNLQEDKLVKYLHREYAHKHATKMNEFKLYYEQELKNRDLTIKKLNRDFEFVLKNLEVSRQKYNELLGEKAEQSEL